MNKFLSIALMILMSVSGFAMERHYFDENQPQGTKSLVNLRNSIRALYQGDFSPLRPRASMNFEDMEYSTTALAQGAWSGTGVTVATESSTVQNGNFSLKLTIDATGNRTVSHTQSIDLSAFLSVTLWEQVNVASSAFQFYLQDSTGNISYWNITSNGTLSTWQHDTLTLASPDANNGTSATLSAITSWGFVGLDASKVYYFDSISAICGMTVSVSGSSIGGDYYQNVYYKDTQVIFSGGAAPAITQPGTNPRIDLLTLDAETGLLAWVKGTEAVTPTAPSFPSDVVPICLVYCKTSMTKVVDYENKDANPNEAYIYKDVRPIYRASVSAVPTGAIIMWSGSIASIPAGWVLCDGTNGTPDMRDRFIVCAGGSYTVGDTGGEASHTLTTSEIPTHNHTASCSSDGSHNHTGTTSTGGNHAHASSALSFSSNNGNTAQGTWMINTAAGGTQTGYAGDHNHTMTTSTATAHSHTITVNNAGTGGAHENRPPYYALAFIMKT